MAWKHINLWALCCIFYCTGLCQQYSFTNYSVAQGLVQSQARDIAQDEFGYIWVATLGGLSRFDGLQFRNYARKDGLSSLLNFRVYPANQKIYLGSQEGIQWFDGRSFQTCSLPKDIGSKAISDILQGNNKQVFFRAAGKIFRIDNSAAIEVSQWRADPVTALASDRNKDIFAAVYKKGIYKWSNHGWQLFLDLKPVDSTIIAQQLFFTSTNQLLLLSNKGVFSVSGKHLSLLLSNKIIASPITAIAEDYKARLWIGTTSGAWLLDHDKNPVYIGSAAGLTDNAILKIITDREGNCWFATDGDGIFKLNNSPLRYVNNEQGMKGNVVMGIAAENENALWLGTSEHGLQRYTNGVFSFYPLPSSNPQAQKTNSLLLDADKQLWIGTLGGGLWCYKNGRFREILTSTGMHFKEIISIYEDRDHTIWICVPSGLFYLSNGSMHKVKELNNPCFSVIERGPDTLLVGTAAGLYQLVGKSTVTSLHIGHTGIVNCFAKWRNYFLLGTEDEGVFFWNPRNEQLVQCNSANGLSSDFIFALYADTADLVFAGTEHGVSSIRYDEKAKRFIVKNHSAVNSLYGPECNLNAVQKTTDGRLWFGTTKGLVLYNPADTFTSRTAPLIYLTAVRLFSNPINGGMSGDTVSAWHQLPAKLLLGHLQNHLTFNFQGLYFSNPAGIKYRYRLEGADTGYAAATTGTEVIYSNLSPGKYRFTSFAIAENGFSSSNKIDFLFEIAAPFYQRWWFKLLVVVLLILSGIVLQYINTRIKIKRADAIIQMKLAEQQKVQERTAEDLHDDLGNKITRISVLADVLDSKINKEDQEKRKLVEQIKENANALYLGTKDIIWSLTPGNDSLYDLLERCRSFGIHLFDGTPVEFTLEGQQVGFREIKVPLHITSNLVMIVKEALNNILKHSGGTRAILLAAITENNLLMITITDNGSGITETVQTWGNGLGNMQRRARRMEGALQIEQADPTGTMLRVSVSIPPDND